MSNPMDNFTNNSFMQALQSAQKNPQAFEEYIKQANPEGYQQALQLMQNNPDPRQLLLSMAQQQGIPEPLLKMLGL